MWRRKPSYRIRGKTVDSQRNHERLEPVNHGARLCTRSPRFDSKYPTCARSFLSPCSRVLLRNCLPFLRPVIHFSARIHRWISSRSIDFFVSWTIEGAFHFYLLFISVSFSIFRFILRLCVWREMNWVWIICKFRTIRWEMTIFWEIEIFGFNCNCGKIRY